MNLVANVCVEQLKFFATLNDRESDFEVTHTFYHVGKNINTESMHNEDQLYIIMWI